MTSSVRRAMSGAVVRRFSTATPNQVGRFQRAAALVLWAGGMAGLCRWHVWQTERDAQWLKDAGYSREEALDILCPREPLD